MQRSNRAFTLIELLVVIAIIAILAAILFPVFAQAKNSAKKTTDLSGAKQLGTASLMYATDFDDVFVPAILNPSDGVNACWSPWYVWLNPYMKTVGPAVEPNWCGTMSAFGGERRSYGFLKSAMAGGNWNSYSANGYVMGFSFPAWGRPDDDPTLSTTAVGRPSEVMLFTIGNSDTGDPYGNAVADLVRPDDLEGAFPSRTDQAQWFVDNWVGKDFTLVNAGWGCPLGPYLCKGPSYRYMRTAPMVFTDGHAKSPNPGRVTVATIFPEESLPGYF
jgi:prepilin-type N-terminal cleavage/methylation domain-containing protein